MSEEEKYDLKDSAKGIGQLYPVLVDKKGRVIDGFHRLQADPTWRVQPLDNIDTDEKLLIARCVANWHRRQVGREEKAEWINGLAEIYQHQEFSATLNMKIAEVTGLHPATVARYLNPKYKRAYPDEGTKKTEIPASQVVESFRGGRYGKELAERFRKEVLEEAKLSPEELAKRREEQEKQKADRKRKLEETRLEKEKVKIEKKAKEIKTEAVKTELLENPEFRREVIRRDLQEMVQKATEERGVPQILDVKRIDEAKNILDEMYKTCFIIQGWGVNQYMILKKFNRLKDAYEVVNMMQEKLQQWRTTQYV